jgi:hypothetical protein
LEGRPITIREVVDARVRRFGSSDLEGLFDGARRIVALRGKKVVDLDMKNGAPDREALEKAVLGPRGNLRAPALRLGKTWVIGFGAETYEELLS